MVLSVPVEVEQMPCELGIDAIEIEVGVELFHLPCAVGLRSAKTTRVCFNETQYDGMHNSLCLAAAANSKFGISASRSAVNHL
jgi:hypothetical protein